MELLQFAEPVEKSKIIYFDRRPESSRPLNQNNPFPKKTSKKRKEEKGKSKKRKGKKKRKR